MANRIQIEISADAREAKEAFTAVSGAARGAFRDIREDSLALDRGLREVRREFSGLAPEFSAGFRQIAIASADSASHVIEETTKLQEQHLTFLTSARDAAGTSLQEQTALWSQFRDTLGGFVEGLETQFITAHQAMRGVGRSTFEGINESLFQLIKGTESLGEVWQKVLDDMLKQVIRFVTSAAIKKLLEIGAKFLGLEAEGGEGGAALAFSGGGEGEGDFKVTGIQELFPPLKNFLKKIPLIGGFFQLGTPFVPRDMLALLHRGEAVLPREMNPFAGSLQGGFNEAVTSRTSEAPRNPYLEGRLDRLMSLLERQGRPLHVRFERGAFQGAHLRDERDVERLALEIEKRIRRRERLQLAPRVG